MKGYYKRCRGDAATQKIAQFFRRSSWKHRGSNSEVCFVTDMEISRVHGGISLEQQNVAFLQYQVKILEIWKAWNHHGSANIIRYTKWINTSYHHKMNQGKMAGPGPVEFAVE